MLYTREGEESIRGVGFTVNKSIKDRVVQYEGINSRAALITIKINKKYLYFCTNGIHKHPVTATMRLKNCMKLHR